MTFPNTLIHWYLQNKRDLPWRKTKEPYFVWLSEIMLQQTRIAQGLDYFLKFKEAFPTIHNLAKADESTVLKLWQGLGYYSRARNLHTTAKYISEELNGKFPDNHKELLKLKGVGDYTASAIASICFDKPEAVVDGNVYRVLSRYYGINTPINSTKGIKEFKELAQTLIDKDQPGIYNQAIMDFGSMQCKPQNPDCNVCPLSNSCVAFEKSLIKELPIKEKKIKIKKRYFHYFIFVTKENKTVLELREGKGIWQGLYQFPLIEVFDNNVDVSQTEEFHKLIPNNSELKLLNSKQIIHKLSHQHLYTTFWKVAIDSHKDATILLDDFTKYPVPVLIAKFIEQIEL